jgi:hypothetical protein
MAEFWISATQNRFLPVATPTAGMSRVLHPARTVASVRQAASAAHVYGKRLTQAEAFTTFNDDWIEYPYALKVPGDEAFCLGLTRNVLCFYVHQPRLDIQPGYQWAHIGTHFDRNITWWSQSHAWLGYLARCQHMLRQGRFVADVLYFSGEVVPNFVPFDAKPVAGHDFDVINAQALLGRASSKDGRMVLADGTSYRYLVLPAQVTDKMTAPVVEKIRALVEGGATVIGGRPRQTPGLGGYPECDRKLKTVADSIWGAADAPSGERMAGEGRVIWGKTVEEVIAADGLRPDIEFRHAASGVKFQWIHRRDGETEIYFVSNAGDAATDVEVEFRVAGKTPELWDAVTGRVRALPEFRMQGGSTAVPMRFEPRQSFFVVFRRSVGSEPAARGRNFPRARKVDEISGPWQVSFNPKWGPARPVVFEQLVDWTRRPEEDIRYYSGAAVYRRSFDAPVQGGERLYLDLGRVHNLARVRLNGRDLGVVWTAPWRVDITDAVKQKENQLEIEVVNLWPNRLIGDGKLPKKRRRTVTNVRTYDAVLPPGFKRYGCLKCERRMKTREAAQLLPSGLLGPVTLCALPEFPRTPSTTTGWRP